MFDPSRPFMSAVAKALRQDFDRWEHRLNEKQFQAIVDIPKTIEEIMQGQHRGTWFLCSAPAGMGKTTAIVRSCREILTNPEYQDHSILVCIPRIAEIRAFLDELGEDLWEHVAVYVNASENDLRGIGLGYENATEARLLVSTQAHVRSLLKGRKKMAEAEELKWRGRGRSVILWDEFLARAKDFAIPVGAISLIGAWLSKDKEFYMVGQTIRKLGAQAELAPDEDELAIPNFVEDFPEINPDILANLASAEIFPGFGDLGWVIENLWELSGLKVRTHKSQGRSEAIITFKEYLPEDLTVIVTDASGAFRQLYEEIKRSSTPNPLVDLKKAEKTYEGLVVNLWNRPAAKHVFARNKRGEQNNPEDVREIIEVCAKLIVTENPNGCWLLVHPGGDTNKGRIVDIPELLKEELLEKHSKSAVWLDHTHRPDADWRNELAQFEAQGLTIACLNWGRHDSTNAFKLFDHIILIGCQYDPDALIEARLRAAGGVPTNEGVDRDRFLETKKGEIRHHVLQALNRGSPRRGAVGRGKIWHIAAHGSYVTAEVYEKVAPGCRVQEWQPVPKRVLKGRMREALDFIVEHFKRSSKPLWPHTVYTVLGISKTNFCKMRKDERFQRELRDRGIEERRQVNGAWAFELSYRVYGFEIEDWAA